MFVTPVVTQPMIICSEAVDAAGGVACVLNASPGSVPYLYAFEVSGNSLTIHQVRFRIGATATGSTNMAIYTAAGNLVSGSDTGALSNSQNTTVTQAYATDITLFPGAYWIAIACTNTTDTYGGITGITARIAGTRHRIGTNVLAAGAMPATLGTITTAANAPFVALIPTGSLIT